MTGWLRSQKQSHIQVGLRDQTFICVGMLGGHNLVKNAAGIADCLNDNGLYCFTKRFMRLA